MRRSVTRTATPGCCRRSRSGYPAASGRTERSAGSFAAEIGRLVADEQTDEPATERHALHDTARVILPKWPVWVVPSVLVTVVMFVLALVYTGGIADPQASLHRLPIALVNRDSGP